MVYILIDEVRVRLVMIVILVKLLGILGICGFEFSMHACVDSGPVGHMMTFYFLFYS